MGPSLAFDANTSPVSVSERGKGDRESVSGAWALPVGECVGIAPLPRSCSPLPR